MIDTLHYIAIVQALLMGVVLLSIRRDGKFEFKYLGILLLCLGLAVLGETYSDYANVDFTLLYPFRFFFLIPNLVFLHVESKMVDSISLKKRVSNLLAGGIEFVFLCAILILVQLKVIHPEGDFLYYFDELYTYLTVLYAVIIQIIILKKIATYNGNLFKYFSTIRYKYLNWLKWVCIIIITTEVYYILFYIFSSDVETNDLFYTPVALLELGLIFYVGTGALLQSNLQIEIPKELLSDNPDPKEDSKTNEVTEIEHKIFEDIEQFMQLNKPFLNADLNLKLLSQLMGISERQISNAINKNTGSNFYTFINQYRVQEAILMLKSEDHAKFSIVGIGEAAGFNSKSSFYNNFRKVTNVSPSRYLQNPS